MCLDRRLEGNHKCRPDSGHDECCICLEVGERGAHLQPIFRAPGCGLSVLDHTASTGGLSTIICLQ